MLSLSVCLYDPAMTLYYDTTLDFERSLSKVRPSGTSNSQSHCPRPRLFFWSLNPTQTYVRQSWLENQSTRFSRHRITCHSAAALSNNDKRSLCPARFSTYSCFRLPVEANLREMVQSYTIVLFLLVVRNCMAVLYVSLPAVSVYSSLTLVWQYNYQVVRTQDPPLTSCRTNRSTAITTRISPQLKSPFWPDGTEVELGSAVRSPLPARVKERERESDSLQRTAVGGWLTHTQTQTHTHTHTHTLRGP